MALDGLGEVVDLLSDGCAGCFGCQVARRYAVNANALACIPDYKITKVDDLRPWHWNG